QGFISGIQQKHPLHGLLHPDRGHAPAFGAGLRQLPEALPEIDVLTSLWDQEPRGREAPAPLFQHSLAGQGECALRGESP
ncbi:MAG TPA: hypothetical protein VEI04_05905, partial [Syntrophobacteria bacterium]|nr:hypothetical protein [Syntrophobacteria bacterium]